VLQAKSTAKEIEKGGEIAVIKDAGDVFSIGSLVNRALFSPEGSSEVYGNASHRDRATGPQSCTRSSRCKRKQTLHR
jgi:hypothetical protein